MLTPNTKTNEDETDDDALLIKDICKRDSLKDGECWQENINVDKINYLTRELLNQSSYGLNGFRIFLHWHSKSTRRTKSDALPRPNHYSICEGHG